MSRNKLYAILAAACAAGYAWLTINYTKNISDKPDIGVCLFKKATGIACPSCGSTRSVREVINGDIAGAFLFNPFGILIIIVLIVSPVWIVYDLITRNDSLHRFYLKAEAIIRRKWFAIPAIALVLLNWIWNIYKGL